MTPVLGRGSLRKSPSAGKVEPEQVQLELQLALQQSLSELGTGGLDIEEIGMRLYGTFNALPKNNESNLEASAVRYLAHSFFLKEYGWLIRGLDPHLQRKFT